MCASTPSILTSQKGATKVKRYMPKRPSFPPITTDELMSEFTRGLAVHNGIIAYALLSHENVAAEASAAPSRKARRHKHRTESDKRMAPREPSCSLELERQRPVEKRLKVEEAPAECDTSSVSTLAESASSQVYHTAESTFKLPHKRKCQSSSGCARGQMHKGGVVALADSNP